MQIKVQECGCIALPAEVAEAIQAGPGTIFNLTHDALSSLVLTRIYTAIAPAAASQRAACPTS